MRLCDLPSSLVYGCAVLLGLFGGSFLNVVIYRVPRGLSIVRPGSHCPECGTPVRFFDNIPLLSYLALAGRARCCKARISPRYFLVELIGGALSLAILQDLATHQDMAAARALAIFGADLAFALSLVAVAFIDMEHMYVPDPISIGGTLFGLATFSLRPNLGFTDAVWGAAFGFGIVWIPFGIGYKLIRGRTGMGLGDAKLVMMAGAWFGWQGAVFALLAGAVQGTLAVLLLFLAQGKVQEPASVLEEKRQTAEALALMGPDERQAAEAELLQDPLYETSGSGLGLSRVAFGPFLVLAMLEYLLVGRIWFGDYVRWLGL